MSRLGVEVGECLQFTKQLKECPFSCKWCISRPNEVWSPLGFTPRDKMGAILRLLTISLDYNRIKSVDTETELKPYWFQCQTTLTWDLWKQWRKIIRQMNRSHLSRSQTKLSLHYWMSQQESTGLRMKSHALYSSDCLTGILPGFKAPNHKAENLDWTQVLLPNGSATSLLCFVNDHRASYCFAKTFLIQRRMIPREAVVPVLISSHFRIFFKVARITAVLRLNRVSSHCQPSYPQGAPALSADTPI